MSARGICGVFGRGGTDGGAVEAMLAELPGRGQSGRLDRGAVSFGYRNLWPGAADAGAGQAQCAGRELCVAADARLDGREELGEALGLARPELAHAADWWLILQAYGRWGADCPLHLHGDYAFAVWDAGARSLFCARDAFGARPLYYSPGSKGRFAFASDVEALLAAPGVDGRLDDDHVADVLTAGHNPPKGSTFFRGVRRLPPGHGVSVDAGGAERVRRWWRPEDAPPAGFGSDDDYAREFLDRYRIAVRDRLRGAHPVGAHLSGGLDSSSVAVLAARELRPSGRRLQAFCWHPPPGDAPTGDEAAEYDLIESVCAQEGLEPHYHSPSADHVLAFLRRDGVRFSDGGGTLIHETLVQRSAAELGVRVILSGWGGDEAASSNGYGLYAELLRGGRWRQLLREAREKSDRPWRFVARNAVLPLAHPHAPRNASALLRRTAPPRRKSFVHPAFARRRRGGLNRSWGTGVRRTQLAALENGHLAQRIEDWAAAGARAGVEYRFPLLDRRLVEFALGLPAEQFRRGTRSRWIMRRALRSVLPPAVLEHSDKRDPARFRPLLAAMDGALPAVLKELADRREPPARAKYLDMPRLLAHLERRLACESPFERGNLIAALRFLDWHSD